jgi:hypothetical protein
MTNPSSRAQEEEFNRWYNEVHAVEMLNISGVLNISRYRAVHQIRPGGEPPAHHYLTVYEIDDAPATVEAIMAARPGFRQSDAVDLEGSVVLVLEPVHAAEAERVA